MDNGEWVSILRVSPWHSNPGADADQIVNIAQRQDLYPPLCVLEYRVDLLSTRLFGFGHFGYFVTN